MDEKGAYVLLDVVKHCVLGLQDKATVTWENGRILTKEELVASAIKDLTMYRDNYLNRENKKVITSIQFGGSTSND